MAAAMMSERVAAEMAEEEVPFNTSSDSIRRNHTHSPTRRAAGGDGTNNSRPNVYDMDLG